MLLHLYSGFSPATNAAGHQSLKLDGEQRPLANGHMRMPPPTARDAQEFELEGLMSDDDEHEPLKSDKANGVPPHSS